MSAQSTDGTIDLILDTASKIFSDHCGKSLLDQAEESIFPRDLWELLKKNGFNQLGSKETGTSISDLYAFLIMCGRFAVPLPISETLLMNLWFGDVGNISGIGELRDGKICEVSGGYKVPRIGIVEKGNNTVTALSGAVLIREGRNLAGEARDSIEPQSGKTLTVSDDPYAQLALSRVCLMAGCMQSVLDLGVQFSLERSQFGRSISKFQAIQHSLAVVACEVAASRRAADAAIDALGDPRFILEVAAAKARVGEAAGFVAEQIHQIHGAMGFTQEHRLHHYTKRLWSWRDEWGNEFYWQQLLGEEITNRGADSVWSFIATSS